MDELDLPYIQIFENGELFDHMDLRQRFPQQSGTVDIVSKMTGKRLRTNIRHLVGYYFDAPWTQQVIIPYRHLECLGYPEYFILCTGQVFSAKRMEYLIGSLSQDGYSRVLLSGLNRFSTEIVHRLVAKMFIPNPDNKPEVNHINGDKSNNDYRNLEWAWSYENMEHALKTGLRKSALSDEQIRRICQMLESGYSVSSIMSELDIPKHLVLGIKSGCHFRISQNYNIPKNRHFLGNTRAPEWQHSE